MNPRITKSCLAAGLLLASLPTCLQAQTNTPTGARLRTLGDANGVKMGTALAGWGFASYPPNDYEGTAAQEFRFFTCEDEMQMDHLEVDQGTFNTTDAPWNTYTVDDYPADWEVNWALSSPVGGAMHGHPLVTWDQKQLPVWLTKPATPWTAQSLTDVLIAYIDHVVGHWKGKIAVWEVVNEAFDFQVNSFNKSLGWTQYLHNNDPANVTTNIDLWQQYIGPNSSSTANYLDMAFNEAHKIDSSAILIYNDHGTEEMTAKADAMYDMAQDFQARGIPINGIGFQSHFTVATPPNYSSVAANLARFAQLGLNLYVTELDVMNPSGSLATTPSLGNDLEARIYHNYMDTCLRCPAVMGFQTWEFGDYFSWFRAQYAAPQYPLLFDGYKGDTNGMRAKPAYYALQDALNWQVRPELLSNIGFESGTSAWLTSGSCTLTSIAGGHSGSKAMSVTGRGASSSGPSQPLTSALINTGAGRYYMGAWVKFSSGSGTVQLMLHLKDAGGDTYPVVTGKAGTGWTYVGGWVDLAWYKTLSNATFSIQTPNTTVDFSVDDVYLGDGNVAANGSFENGVTSWTGSGCTLTATTADAEYHYGAGGVKASSLTATSQGPQQNVLSSLLARGPGSYTFQAYMKVSSTNTINATGSMVLKLTYGGKDYYTTVASNAVSSLNWTKVASSSPVNVQWTSTPTAAVLYLETPGSTTDFCADDVLMRQ